MQRDGPPPSWSDIPWDLAGRVLRLLPAYVDRARSAAVCPQWRRAARQLLLPPPLPLLAVPDGSFYSVPYGKPFRFPGFCCADFKAAACGSWLVFPRDDGCFLVDPFARATVELPSLSRIRLRPTQTLAPLTSHGCPGASSWSVRAYDACRPYEDMAFYQGKLYNLVTGDESLLVVNISQDPGTGDPQVARIGQVLEADWEHSRWVKVATLGDDLMLFLGRSCSKVVRASQYGMSDDVFENDEDNKYNIEGATSVGVYDMRTGEISSPLPMVWKRKMVLATWLFLFGLK
ncbi:hypothetical protein HU200_058500 [Digitaria exilis]|uniref:KIB1-4 beta-propeller domain-containing protein n=1 Tax=Digitaria exilis TaxID=1010633 RepID=A0A835AJ93_9POAL|nr:hypothetical protein HU200_058500 [Digitaria exilis]